MQIRLRNNSEVAHCWANQTQYEGRVSNLFTQYEGRVSNLFFEGNTIYSYGYHYVAGVIHTRGNETLCLLNNYSYSISTQKHMSIIRGATRHLDTVLVSNPDDIPTSIKYLMQDIDDHLEKCLKRKRIHYLRDIGAMHETAYELLSDVNKLCKFIGEPAKAMPAKFKEVETHLVKLEKRWHELNTPEMIAKREAARKEREAKKAAKLEAELFQKLIAWKNGGRRDYRFNELPYDRLRIQDTFVQTSGGATVDLCQAKTLLRMIERGENIRGYKINGFPVMGTKPLGSDTIVQIGCHKILLSEAKEILQ